MSTSSTQKYTIHLFILKKMQVAQMRLTTSSRRLLGLKAHSASPLLVHIVVSWQLESQANIHEYIYIYIIIIIVIVIITILLLLYYIYIII